MDLARNSIWEGRLTLWQPEKGQGYRFNLDSLLLADFVRPGNHVIDLGAGCGVVGLVLLGRGHAQSLTAVENQPSMAELIRKNALENGMDDCVEIYQGDLRELTLPKADRVVFNPPYFKANEGRRSPVAGRDAGRFETAGTLNDFVRVGLMSLVEDGELFGIVPRVREEELVDCLRDAGFGASRIRRIRARADAPDDRVLIAGSRAAFGLSCCVETPLVVHGGKGRDFTPEVSKLLAAEGFQRSVTRAADVQNVAQAPLGL